MTSHARGINSGERGRALSCARAARASGGAAPGPRARARWARARRAASPRRRAPAARGRTTARAGCRRPRTRRSFLELGGCLLIMLPDFQFIVPFLSSQEAVY